MRCVANALHPWDTGEIGFWIDDAFLDETARRVTRLEQLEQLCRDMYEHLHSIEAEGMDAGMFFIKRMYVLGLLEGEEDGE